MTPSALAADDLSKPITVSPDGRFLQQADGQPFFWLGDTAWELLHRLDRDEADQYLQDRASKGFNVIQVVATGQIRRGGLDAVNRYGELPFLGRDPANPNPRYFEFVDWVVGRAARYGIHVALLPVWGQNFVSGARETRVFTPVNAEIYGRWIGRRYRDQGIIWVLGGDVTPLWPTASEFPQGPIALKDYRPVYDAMARGIEAGAGKDQLLTYHLPGGSPMATALPRTSLFFGDRAWLDMNMIQSSHAQSGPGADQGGDYGESGFIWNATFNYLPISAEYRSHPTRPIIDGEPGYEDHPIWGPRPQTGALKAIGFWKPHQIRGALYHALFAGAAGHTYGHFSIWDLYDPARRTQQISCSSEDYFKDYVRQSWQEALNAPGAGQMQHAKALMLSRPYFTRVPDQSVIVGEAGEGEAHIGGTRERTGSYLMIYLPQGQPVTVDLTKLSGLSAVGWWFDPRTGEAKRIGGEWLTGQPHRFTPPTTGVDQDWVLVLDDASRKFPQPGITRSSGGRPSHPD